MKIPFGKSKKTQIPRGRFIVLDGIDGSGKSTQLRLLEEELKVTGFTTENIHFPQHGQPSAALVDEYLSGKHGSLNPYATSIFFAVDRFEAKKTIEQWVTQGKIVLCDRYVTSNAGHQGGKISDEIERVKYFKWLDNLEYNIFGIPKPDLNIILNVDAHTATKRLKERSANSNHVDNMHEKDLKHLQNSHQVYKEIAKMFPNTKLVECSVNGQWLTPEQIHNKVWDLVRRIVLKDLNP